MPTGKDSQRSAQQQSHSRFRAASAKISPESPGTRDDPVAGLSWTVRSVLFAIHRVPSASTSALVLKVVVRIAAAIDSVFAKVRAGKVYAPGVRSPRKMICTD